MTDLLLYNLRRPQWWLQPLNFVSRLSETNLSKEEKQKITEAYFGLHKESLADVIWHYSDDHNLIQVTTFSRLLTEGGKVQICERLGRSANDVQIITLQQINTEEQFSKQISQFLSGQRMDTDSCQILIVQGQVNPEVPQSFVECVRYSILNQVQLQERSSKFCIILVLQIPRIFGGFFSGFPGIQWKAFHIDELCGEQNGVNVASYTDKTLHDVLGSLNLRKVVSEAIPKAASIAFDDEDLASARVVDCVEILTQCFAGQEEVSSTKIILAKS